MVNAVKTYPVQYGPCMQAITDLQRRFVIAYNDMGGTNASAAAKVAGSIAKHLNVAAAQLLHTPSVQAAMLEDIKARFTCDLSETKALIDDIARHSQHVPTKLKALLFKAHQGGLVDRTIVEQNVTVTLTPQQRIQALVTQAQAAGIDLEKLAPGLAAQVTDAEFVDVAAIDLEDLI